MLEKIFIKNYKNVKNTEVRNNYGQVAGMFGIITNIILGLSKVAIGALTNSVSIIADAVNNITDTIASTLTVMGFKISNKKPSEEHPYGYARYEYVANMFVSIFVLVMGLFFAKESIYKIMKPETVVIDAITIIVLVLAIIVKCVQVKVYLRFSKKIGSETLKTTATDSTNDIITTLVILLSMIAMLLFKINIDGIMGLLVSLFIIYNAITMLKSSLNPIIGVKPTKDQVDMISKKILKYDNVLGIHDLIIHNYGVNFDFVTVHVEMNEKLGFNKAHDVAEQIEEDFYNDLGINITVHMDPVDTDDKETEVIKDQVQLVLKKFDESISIHDFRLIKYKDSYKILFDIVESYKTDYKVEEIIEFLNKEINSKKIKYNYIIKIDRLLV